ncbi:methylmalonyl-CoA mutase [Archaeoglobales archaeon]|nr:MAG: methylmalonyl-CoA mutase [Archaeoglobales archaeon]
MEKGGKILLAKIGIDGHDRGFRTIAAKLRDNGFKVILLGPWSSVDEVVNTALQEDPDVVGISTLGGDYLLIPKLIDKFKEMKLDVPIILGGIIPPEWEKKLKEIGVKKIFHPGTDLNEVVRHIRELAFKKRG